MFFLWKSLKFQKNVYTRTWIQRPTEEKRSSQAWAGQLEPQPETAFPELVWCGLWDPAARHLAQRGRSFSFYKQGEHFKDLKECEGLPVQKHR